MSELFISLVSEADADQANVFRIQRRGFFSGFVRQNLKPELPSAKQVAILWQQNKPALIPGMLKNNLPDYSQAISQSKNLYATLLKQQEIGDALDVEPYISRLGDRFELLSTRFDESDRQEIESVDFDVLENGELVMEDIWMRASWLSYHAEDESLRFRFSFGMEGFEDVSQDYFRQKAAADLCQRLFPESSLISENEILTSFTQQVLQIEDFEYLERIVYFNAPNGGAQFHHDAEKGHLGVVYAQVTGSTFWLALSKQQLLDEIIEYMQSEENRHQLQTLLDNNDEYADFQQVISDRQQLISRLDDPTDNVIDVLLNQSNKLFQQLVNKGYGYILQAGDVILLPQESLDACAWHSVFCLGDDAGEALSFAIKPKV